MISSTQPHSFSTMIASSIRIGWVMAIWMPATRLESTGCMASPRISPAAPAEAAVSRGLSNRDEVYLLARVIEGEAADEPFEGKVAVGAVILNRTRSAAFPHTLAGVIFQPHAFESVANGQYNRPVSEESLRAALLAMSGWDPTGGAIYFWNPAKPVNPWVWSRNIVTQIGRHVFAR